MFNNRFNSTKKDPLVEAVQTAMQDGEIRRQAIAQVNEAFGVYNRNAVVREQLADYDAAIEEAYKCMKEGEKKDEKKEDKPKADYSKMREKMVGKDTDRETTRKIVGEEQIEEISKGTLGSYVGKSASANYGKEKLEREKGVKLAMKKISGKGVKVKATNEERADKDYDKDGKIESPKDEVWGSRFRAAKMAGKMEEEQIDELKKPTPETALKVVNRANDRDEWSAKAANRLYSRYKKGYEPKEKKTEVKKEETDYSAPDRAAVTRDNKPSTPAQTNSATSGPSAADKAALTSKIKTMKEAAYSAKAARAGKDIGKPGKEFSKIAAKAGKRYGSEERGKKVAGAILKRIRAKHMKEENLEELSAFGKAFAAAKGQNFSFGGKQYSGAMKDQTGSSSTSRPSVTSAPKTNTPGTQGVATGKSFAAIDKATAKAEKATPKVTAPSTPSAGAARDVSMTGKAGGETGVTSGSTVSLDRPGNVGARPTGAGAAGTVTGGAPTPAPSSPPEQSRAAPGTFAARSASGEMKADAASAGVKKLMSMNESVQVGANKYRIV